MNLITILDTMLFSLDYSLMAKFSEFLAVISAKLVDFMMFIRL